MSDEYVVANQNIPFGGALAYTKGQLVHRDAVEANDWQDLVVPRDSSEAEAIFKDALGPTADDESEPEQPEPAPAKTATPAPVSATSTAVGGKDK